MVRLPSNKWMLPICLLTTLALPGCTSTTPVGSVGKPKLFPLAVRSDPTCDGQDPRGPFNGACTPERLHALAFAAMDQESILNMPANGTCEEVRFDFGDGTPPETFVNMVFTQNWQLRHTYTGWPGKKMVRVKGLRNCLADSSLEISVGYEPEGRETFRTSFRPNSMQCNPVIVFSTSGQRPMPPIRKGSTVRISTDGGRVNYGNANSVFNASGDPSVPLPIQGYLFPDHRKFSLVYRIGSQLVQGEAGPVVFTATQTALLEVCVNDNPSYLTDNTGGMLLIFNVNESSAE